MTEVYRLSSECTDNAPVRLATWNCCGQFEANLSHLLDLGVDAAVISEARVPAEWPAARGRAVSGLGRRVLEKSWKEVAVVARHPWTVTPHDAYSSAPAWLLPVLVDGPTPFALLGLWPVRSVAYPSYVGQISAAVDWLVEHCTGVPVVLAGDFNAPIASSQREYDAVADRLHDFGLVDALTVSLEPQDRAPTYYHQRKRDRPFHIDHVFLPAPWADVATVEVGDFDTWVGSGRSDHVPVVVELPEDELTGQAADQPELS